MKVKTGIDIVYLPRFKKALKNGGQKFLQRVFLIKELTDKNIPRLAGIFAAKEAVIKALSLPVDSFHDVYVTHTRNGAPKLEIRNLKLEIRNSSLSISHDGNYVIAHFVACLPAGRHY